jgi:hypothetical protein
LVWSLERNFLTAFRFHAIAHRDGRPSPAALDVGHWRSIVLAFSWVKALTDFRRGEPLAENTERTLASLWVHSHPHSPWRLRSRCGSTPSAACMQTRQKRRKVRVVCKIHEGGRLRTFQQVQQHELVTLVAPSLVTSVACCHLGTVVTRGIADLSSRKPAERRLP